MKNEFSFATEHARVTAAYLAETGITIPRSIKLRRTLFTSELKSGRWAWRYGSGIFCYSGIRATRELAIESVLASREDARAGQREIRKRLGK